jgi:hypothetical protein
MLDFATNATVIGKAGLVGYTEYYQIEIIKIKIGIIRTAFHV